MDDEYDPPSPIHASQIDDDEAERLMQQSELFTEQSEFDNDIDLDMLRQGKYEDYINNKLLKQRFDSKPSIYFYYLKILQVLLLLLYFMKFYDLNLF